MKTWEEIQKKERKYYTGDRYAQLLMAVRLCQANESESLEFGKRYYADYTKYRKYSLEKADGITAYGYILREEKTDAKETEYYRFYEVRCIDSDQPIIQDHIQYDDNGQIIRNLGCRWYWNL